MKNFKSFLLGSLVAAMSVTGILKAEDLATFYQQPSAEAFQRVLEKEFSEASEDSLGLMALYVHQVAMAHPDYAGKLDVSKLPSRTQATLLAGLRSSAKGQPVPEGLDTAENRLAAKDIQVVTTDDWDSFAVQEAGDLDVLWASFFATGEKKYVQKVLETISESGDFIIVQAGIWSLESLCEQDPYIARLVAEIMKETPSLDYAAESEKVQG